MRILRSLGRSVITLFTVTGRIGIFTGNGVFHCFSPPFFPRLILQQMVEIGFYSLPVVGLTAIFTGAVLALQSFSGFGFAGESTIANVVVWGITRELGPVLAGLMVAGRVGAAMAAELSSSALPVAVLWRSTSNQATRLWFFCALLGRNGARPRPLSRTRRFFIHAKTTWCLLPTPRNSPRTAACPSRRSLKSEVITGLPTKSR